VSIKWVFKGVSSPPFKPLNSLFYSFWPETLGPVGHKQFPDLGENTFSSTRKMFLGSRSGQTRVKADIKKKKKIYFKIDYSGQIICTNPSN
jgi:hypothetical protein